MDTNIYQIKQDSQEDFKIMFSSFTILDISALQVLPITMIKIRIK